MARCARSTMDGHRATDLPTSWAAAVVITKDNRKLLLSNITPTCNTLAVRRGIPRLHTHHGT